MSDKVLTDAEVDAFEKYDWQCEHEPSETVCINCLQTLIHSLREARAERDRLQAHLAAIINDQCWVKKVDAEKLIPREEFLRNCEAHYACLQRGEFVEVNLEAELVREELRTVRTLRELAGAACKALRKNYWHLSRNTPLRLEEVRALEAHLGEAEPKED